MNQPLIKIKQEVIEQALKALAIEVINRIQERTQKGINREGKKFQPYSERPFALPAGAFFAPGWKTSARKMYRQKMIDWFTEGKGETRRKWVVVKGGYKAMKSTRFPQDKGRVNLTLSGRMLNSIVIVEQKGDEITIGFTNKELAELALIHELGLGRNPARPFMDLTPKEEKELIEEFTRILVEKAIEVNTEGFGEG